MTELTEADFEQRHNSATQAQRIGAFELYTAYREAVGGIAYNGEKIPEWPNIKWRAKWGWIAAFIKAEELAGPF